MNRIRGPFPLTNSAQAACLAAVGDQAFVARSREHNLAERVRFAAKLGGLANRGLRVLPSEANFVLVLFEGTLSAEAAFNGLAKQGYIVRWLPGQGLPQALRITIGTPEQMDDIARILGDLATAA